MQGWDTQFTARSIQWHSIGGILQWILFALKERERVMKDECKQHERETEIYQGFLAHDLWEIVCSCVNAWNDVYRSARYSSQCFQCGLVLPCTFPHHRLARCHCHWCRTPRNNYQSNGHVSNRMSDTKTVLTSADSFMIRQPSGVKLSAPVIRVSYSLSARSGSRLIALLRIQSMKQRHRVEFASEMPSLRKSSQLSGSRE